MNYEKTPFVVNNMFEYGLLDALNLVSGVANSCRSCIVIEDFGTFEEGGSVAGEHGYYVTYNTKRYVAPGSVEENRVINFERELAAAFKTLTTGESLICIEMARLGSTTLYFGHDHVPGTKEACDAASRILGSVAQVAATTVAI